MRAKGAFDLYERLQSLPLEMLQTVEGPYERTPRAEAAAFELERQFLNDDPESIYGESWREHLGDVDWAARAHENACRLIQPVGIWWNAVIAERLASTRTD